MSISSNDLGELWQKIEKVRIGMLTTLNRENRLYARPMTAQEVDNDGCLWFFTSDTSELAVDLSSKPAANITFAEPKDSFYVSLSGTGELIRDRERYKALWNPLAKAWFPRGVDDPHLALLRFTVETAEYWDSDSSRMVQLLKMAGAAITGKQPKNIGTHGTVQL